MSQSLTQDPAWLGDAPIVQHDREESERVNNVGNWPRMIKLEPETEDRLRMWLDDEIEGFNTERGPLLDDWKNWQTLYWAAPAGAVKNFPFQRAANVVLPLAAIAVESIHARMMNTLFSVEPFYSIRPRSKEWITAAKPFESYLQSEIESHESLKMYEFCNDSLLELEKLGTCVGKSGYEKLTKKSLKRVGGEDQVIYATIHNGATLDRVPLANFMLRFAELDPQDAPWCGEKHEFGWGKLKKLAQDGRIRAEQLERIKAHWVEKNQSSEIGDGASQMQAKVAELTNTEPIWTEMFEVHELWATFDVDGDGEDEEIVIDYHKDSGTFLSIRYNWYDDLHRPYRICNYHNVEGIWPGLGICKQVEQFQAEATTIHNQRLDNATLANMSQLILRKNMGYGPGEPIFPGKMWFVDDPQKDVREFKLSEVYNSSFNNEESTVRWFEKATGVNEAVLGIPQEGTPGTATSDLTRLAEGNKRFDLVLKNIRRFLSRIGSDIVTNYQLYGNQDAHWLVLGEDGIHVEKILQMPAELIRKGAIIDLTVTDSITNREQEQRTWMQLFQILSNYYGTVTEKAALLAQILGDEGAELLMQVLQKSLVASDEALKRLLETFAVTDSDRFSLVEDGKNGGLAGGPAGESEGEGTAGNTGNGTVEGLENNSANAGGPASQLN